MTASDADLKDALRVYVRAACAALKASGWSLPPVDERGDGWVHLGDDSFVLRSLHRSERLLPTVYGPQHAGPEHFACVEVLKAHPVIGPRLNHLVGSELGASLLDSEGIPDRCLAATLRAGMDVAFDEPAFERAADALIDWLTRSVALHTTVAPLPSIDVDLLGADAKAARRVAVEMRRVYDARSRLAHGVAADALRMKHPDRRPATLSEYVAIAEGHVRDALRLTVSCRAETGRSPMDDWDKFVFGRLDGGEDAADE